MVEMVRSILLALAFAIGLQGMAPAMAANAKRPTKHKVQRPAPPPEKEVDGLAEARLIEIYKLVGNANNREALTKAGSLVADYPHFQLAQLVLGDLLAARVRPLQAFGDIPSDVTAVGTASTLRELREESIRRVVALRDRPMVGTIPSQFLTLSPKVKHAVAVDASRSRLYLFENTPQGLSLMADYYISIGKAGTSKASEGDQRTPLGVYFITSNLDPRSLKNFYGSGALPINYPNVLDSKRGKTGGGIWLHGTPPNQYSRAPQATDGCVVLANPDLQHVIRTVEIRTTPVVIASELHWVATLNTRAEGKPFEVALNAWRNAKTTGNLQQVLSYYTPDFTSQGKTLSEWTPTLKTELDKTQGQRVQLKDVSYLRWTDAADTMVVTFGEVADGAKVGLTKRQYWIRQENQWKIFSEGVI